MDNDRLFNILEKLLDELEYYASADPMTGPQTIQYCQEIRNVVFDENVNLTFKIKEE